MLHEVAPHHACPRLDHRMFPVGIVEFLAGPRHRLAIVGEVALHLVGIGLPSFETMFRFGGGGFLGAGGIEGGEGVDETGGSEGVFGVVVTVGRRRRQRVVVRIGRGSGGTVTTLDGKFEIGGFDHASELSPQRAHPNFPPRNDECIPHRRRRRLVLLFSSVILAVGSIAHPRSASCTATVILILLILPFHFHGRSTTIVTTTTTTTASSILHLHLNLVMTHHRPLHFPSLAHIRLDLAPIQLPEPVHSRNMTMADPALIFRQHVEEGGHAGGKGGGIDRFSFLLLGAQ
mmetsp:Transcript_20024/g.41985  ORF Transcript_20024/g.41985 Transcript_20024/m.41985 type:complete len:289 (+) Transcript_20024:1850-2716(+)